MGLPFRQRTRTVDREKFNLAAALFLVALFGGNACRAANVADFYVSPTGTSDGNGSLSQPWSLSVALAHPAVVKPGATIWLRGGVYDSKGEGFFSRLQGAPGKYITVRQYPGERAILDANAASGTGTSLTIFGSWTTFWGFEVTNSASNRQFRPGDVGGEDAPHASNGVHVRAPNNRFINLIVHDATGSGIGLFSEAADSAVYGCLIYYNGLHKHQHGIYTNGAVGTKYIRDNIIFSNAGLGLTVHSASAEVLKGYEIEGNTFFSSGFAYSGSRNIDIGQGKPVMQLSLYNNYTYEARADRTDVQLQQDATSKDVIIQDNYFAGVGRWRPATMTGNTFVARSILGRLEPFSSTSVWDKNTYFSIEDPGRPFSIGTSQSAKPLTFSEWKAATGYDAHSTFTSGRPKKIDVFVRPNRYEPGRAHIIVYNWLLQSSVSVNIGSLLAKGRKYEVRNAQNYFAAPVLTGTYDGKSLRLPMTGLSIAKPVSPLPTPPRPTGAEFNVFVLIPR
jgi:Right handed beta helix region